MGMDWSLAPTLVVFRSEVNELYPKRDKTSDGTLGNAAHASGTSDHNPDDRGVVCAIDIDEDLLGPTDAYPSFHSGAAARPLVNRILELVRAGKLPQLYYLIYEGKIYSRTYGFTERTYSGSNLHDHHFHISVYHTASLADSTRPWGLKEENELASAQEILDAIDKLPTRREILTTTIQSNKPDFNGWTLQHLLDWTARSTKAQGVALAKLIAGQDLAQADLDDIQETLAELDNPPPPPVV